MIEGVVIPELPPEFAVIETVRNQLWIRKKGAYTYSMRVVSVPHTSTVDGTYHLSMQIPSKPGWAYGATFDTAQDAVDAGVARLWLGVFE